MKKQLLSLALPLAASLATAQVSITLNLADRGPAVSPTLYGIFYEDINHSADGGLYAELIRNRSFEELTAEPVQSWRAVGNATLTLTTDDLLNDKQGHALLLAAGEAGAGAQNEGYWGIRAERGKVYNLSLWAKSVEGKCGAMVAQLVAGDGRIIGEARLEAKLNGKWQKLSTTIMSTDNDPQASFRLTLEKPATVALDVVSLFPPTYNNRPNGLREDLMEMLVGLRPQFLRFPGGCYVEGQRTPEAAFRWERTVGPIEQRPGHDGVNWGYWISDGMGFHEFLQMAEDLNAKPLYVVNVGIWHGGFTPVEEVQPWIDEMMNALEYANGSVDTKYGRMRADNGHPEPFGIEYLEIGNENANFDFTTNTDQSERYHERYALFRDAVLAKYPAMHIIGNVEAWGTDTPSWRSTLPVDILDEHYYRTPSWFADAYNKYDTYDRNGPQIYVGEYAVTSQFGKVGNLNAALGEAVYMLGMERNADIVCMASYAPLFVNENAFNWPTDMIHYNSAEVFATPSYWVQSLFAQNLGGRILKEQTTWTLPEEELEPLADKPLRVGVSSWGTRATYKEPRLIVDGAEVDLGHFATWQKPPTSAVRRDLPPASSAEPSAPPSAGAERRMPRARQDWSADSVTGEVTNLGSSEGRKWMSPQEFTAERYSFEVKAKKERGAEGFLVVYNYRNERDFDWLNIGGWGNTQNAVEQSIDGGRTTISTDSPFTVEDNRWYTLRIDVDGDQARAFVDQQEVLTAKRRSGAMRGVYTSTTLDEETNTLYAKVVNVGAQGTDGTLNLEGGRATTAELTRLSSLSGQDENTMDHQLNIVPRPGKVDIGAGGQRLTFPVLPYSINIIKCKLGD